MNENSLLTKMNAIPPWQVRILAVEQHRPMTTLRLSAKSGLSPFTIKSLARADSWLGYELRTIIAFTSACGVDLLRQKYAKQRLLRMMRSMKGPPHLRTEQRKYWNSIFIGEKQWRKSA